MSGPGFGRLPAIDENDKRFPLRALPPVPLPASKLWPLWNSYLLDQGATSSCVGHGWAHFLAAAPNRHPVESELAHSLYRQAQTMDEWPGEEPSYFGTSVRAGAKACQAMGLIAGEYRWGFTEREVRDFVLGRGPVVIGVSWMTGMMDTDARGYLSLDGIEEGGHAVCLVGYSAERTAYRGVNSWGRAWGQDGRFWLRQDDFLALLEERGGEAVSAVEAAA